MEEKKFFEVFPSLKLKTGISGVFAEGIVTHISMNSAKTCIKIYIRFNRLIGRNIISEVEQEIARQIKPFSGMKIIIIERFNLSSLHTPETILTEYRDSILFELGKKNKISEQIFRTSNMKFLNDGIIEIRVADNMVSRTRTPDIIEMLIEMMENRFGMSVVFNVIYEEREESRHSKEAEYKVLRIVE